MVSGSANFASYVVLLTTLPETAVASYCPFTAGICRRTSLLKKQQLESNSAAQHMS